MHIQASKSPQPKTSGRALASAVRPSQNPPARVEPAKPDAVPRSDVYASAELGQLLDSEVDRELDTRRQEELARLGQLATHD